MRLTGTLLLLHPSSSLALMAPACSSLVLLAITAQSCSCSKTLHSTQEAVTGLPAAHSQQQLSRKQPATAASSTGLLPARKSGRQAVVVAGEAGMSYDEVEIEDMKWDEQLQAYTYSCPCGDLFQITLVSKASGAAAIVLRLHSYYSLHVSLQARVGVCG